MDPGFSVHPEAWNRHSLEHAGNKGQLIDMWMISELSGYKREPINARPEG
jgi:hypothetical protein